MGNTIKKYQQSPWFPSSENEKNKTSYDFILTEPSQSNLNLSAGLGINPPKPSEVFDSSKTGAYYYSGNLCWLVGLLLIIIVFAIMGSILDAGLLNGWSSQGSKRLNDRHVPISSVHSGNVKLESPLFMANTSNSTTITPAIWGSLVFFASYGGHIRALFEHTGELAWEVNICVDLYGLAPIQCHADTLLGKYITVATPTVWGDHLVIAIKKPADIVIIEQKTGKLVKKSTLTTNERASLTQSGTVWDDFLIIGSAISDEDAYLDYTTGCTFIGQLWKWDLEEMKVIWVTNMQDPNNEHPDEPTGFTGMGISGSSPALSVKHGMVAVSVGSVVCTPSWYQTCIGDCNAESFDYMKYERSYSDCDNNNITKSILYNSVAVFRLEDGSLYWHEKLLGNRAWTLSCSGYNSTHPCVEFTDSNDPSDCDFYNNPYINCPSQVSSCEKNYEFVDDPTMQIHSNGDETLYVMQHSGIIYSFDLVRKDNFNDEDNNNNNVHHSGQVLWARAVSQNDGAGGIAVDKGIIYFSLYNEPGGNWTIDDKKDSITTCGGWGAIYTHNGMPIWYKKHPLCNSSYPKCEINSDCHNSNNIVDRTHTGGKSAPSITNDLVFVTSSDTSRHSHEDEDEELDMETKYCGGHVYALHAHDGSVVSSYQTGEPFGEQGVSIYGRCVYAGNGLDPHQSPYPGRHLYGWCVKNAYVNEDEDEGEGGEKAKSHHHN